jgi:hypothetical protein
MRCLPKFFLLLLILPSLPQLSPPAVAQKKAEPFQDLGLQLLTRKAGYIFVGTVSAVERPAPAVPNAVAAVRVSFRVEQAIRGVQAGQTLLIREWAGLWESGPRYYPGERLLLFLYAPSKLGLTSTVGGQLGRFPVDHDGQISLQPGQLQALESGSPAAAQVQGRRRVSSRDLAGAIRRAAEE